MDDPALESVPRHLEGGEVEIQAVFPAGLIGTTGEEKRPSMDLKRAGSLPHSACSSALPVNP